MFWYDSLSAFNSRSKAMSACIAKSKLHWLLNIGAGRGISSLTHKRCHISSFWQTSNDDNGLSWADEIREVRVWILDKAGIARHVLSSQSSTICEPMSAISTYPKGSSGRANCRYETHCFLVAEIYWAIDVSELNRPLQSSKMRKTACHIHIHLKCETLFFPYLRKWNGAI